MIKVNEEEEQRLKYLEFVQVATIHALMCLTNAYGYAKDKSGPLKPGVETVEGTVKSVVGPVYDKFHDVPIEVLKFVDRKVSYIESFLFEKSYYRHGLRNLVQSGSFEYSSNSLG